MPRDPDTAAETIRQTAAQRAARYAQDWQTMVAQWGADEPEDRLWVMYSANYLLRTGSTRWAIDPFDQRSRLPAAPAVDLERGLAPLNLVVLTHRHADHFDLSLIHALRRAPIWWVVPEFLYAPVVEQAGVPAVRVIVPKMMERIEVDGVALTPFAGLHWERRPHAPQDPPRGVPAAGVLAEFGGRRCLFPGDTRTYDAAQMPAFGGVDWVFAHVWLGRGCALMDEPPLLDAFCRFALALQPAHLILTHLHELGRQPKDYWDETHAGLVRRRLRQLAPDLPVEARCFGESTALTR